MWFRHPKPFIQKPVATQTVKRSSAPAPETHSITVERHDRSEGDWPEAPVHVSAANAPLRFSVAYSLRDYLGVLQEHVALEVGRQRQRATPSSRLKRIGQPLLGLAIIAAALYGFGLMQPAALALLVAAALVLTTAPFTLPAWVVLVGTPVYLIKRVRMPLCDFVIDAHKVTRTSAAGTLVKPWSELVEARAYAGSYLLVFARGAIPVPYRCLSAEQLAQLRALIGAVRVQAMASAKA